MRPTSPTLGSIRLLCCGALLYGGISSSAIGDEPATVPEAAALAPLKTRFQSGLERIVAEQDVPGVTAAFIMADDRLVALAAGFADQEQRLPMTPDKRMPAGSVGKTFVAATVLSLAQDGKLALDDKVEKWLGAEPWFAELPNAHELTVRHLLMHRGGLSDHLDNPNFAAQVKQKVSRPGGNPDFYFKPVELVELILKRKPLFAAGNGYAYTDTGYILLGLIIERAGGSAYYEQLQARFLRPLRLTRTVPADRRDLSDLAAGYLLPTNPLGLPEKTLQDGVLRFNPANEWTGGGLVSNPQDLAHWAKLLYEGKAMPQPYLEEMLRTAPEDSKRPSRYGLGVSITDTPMGTLYGHGGFFPGYLTYMAYSPRHRVAVAAQFNSDHPKDTAKTALMQLIADLLETAGPAR